MAFARARREPPRGRRGTNCVHGARRKRSAVSQRALVRDEFNGDAARRKRVRQRLGRKEMSAGAAGGDQREGPTHAAAGSWSAPPAPISVRTSVRGRLRVTASRKPMPRDSEISDEPP